MNTKLSLPHFDYEPEKLRNWTDPNEDGGSVSGQFLILPQDSRYFKRQNSANKNIFKNFGTTGKWKRGKKEDFWRKKLCNIRV